jgi:thiol-disulfide isomerase/thioredoxin
MTRVPKAKHARFFIGCVVIAAGILLLTFSAAAQGKTVRKARGTAAMKSPTVPAINAEEMQQLLKRDGNRPLLVNFWATWCIPCRVEFPDLIKIDKDYRAKGLDFIAITLDDVADRETAVPQFLSQMKAQMPVYLLNVPDPDPAINWVDPQWGGVLPATFLYNNKGKVVYKHFGPIKTTELRSAIERLVGSKQ